MSADPVLAVAEKCLEMDQAAQEIYARLAQRSQEQELRELWEEMAADEQRHVSFWHEVRKQATEGKLPQAFDNAEQTLAELEALQPAMRSLGEQSESADSAHDSFMVALRLEFYLLHSAFETLFHVLGSSEEDEASPEIGYESHLDRLLRGMDTYLEASPELALIGESIRRLWRDNQVLAQRALQDALTSLLNRQGFFMLAQHLAHLAHRRSSELGVLIIDVDHFKRLNDKHGRKVGDRVLVAIGKSVVEQIRRSDIAGRYGGEEFVVLMPDTDTKSAAVVGERIRAAVARIATAEDIRVTVSIGVAAGKFGSDAGLDLDKVIDTADKKLYKAKWGGRNQICYS